MKGKEAESMVNINLRVPNELLARIEKAVSLSGGMDKAEVMRMALDCGLDEMQRVGFDVRKVYKKAIAAAKAGHVDPPAVVNDLPGNSLRSIPAGGAREIECSRDRARKA